MYHPVSPKITLVCLKGEIASFKIKILYTYAFLSKNIMGNKKSVQQVEKVITPENCLKVIETFDDSDYYGNYWNPSRVKKIISQLDVDTIPQELWYGNRSFMLEGANHVLRTTKNQKLYEYVLQELTECRVRFAAASVSSREYPPNLDDIWETAFEEWKKPILRRYDDYFEYAKANKRGLSYAAYINKTGALPRYEDTTQG